MREIKQVSVSIIVPYWKLCETSVTAVTLQIIILQCKVTYNS